MRRTILTACTVMFLAGSALAQEFELTVNIIGDGIVDPNGGSYASGSVVTIATWPGEGQWVNSWSGTDNDWSIDLTNTVTMDANKVVTVEFGPAIIVNRPAEGEVWAAGSSHNIRWSSYGASNVDIWFSGNSGMSWQVIEGGVADTGSYTWGLPGTVDSSQCVILVVPSVPDPNAMFLQSGVFAIRPYASGSAVTSKWKSLGGDFDRIGLSEDYGPELGCVKWQFEVDGAISASVTVGLDETVYVPCEDGRLYKLDANGVVLWSYDANSPLISSPTIGPDGTVYVGGKNGRLYAIDIDGNLRWTHSTDGFIYSSPAVSGDGNSIYVCSQDGKMYALGADGSELWSFETSGFGVIGGSVFASPAIGADETVYIGGLYDPNLYALDPNDGGVKWVCHFDSNGWPFASPVVAPDGTIYQTLLYDPHLYAIDGNDGNILWATNLSEIVVAGGDSYSRWFEPYYHEGGGCSRGGLFEYYNAQYDVGDSGWSEPVLGPDGTIYVSLDDPWVRAVDPNGSMKWATRPGEKGTYTYTCGDLGCGWYRTSPGVTSGFSLTVDSNSLVYAGSDDSNLYVLDRDGFEVARFDSNDSWLGLPVISADNTVVVGDSRDNSTLISYENNKVWAISRDDCGGGERDLYWQGGEHDLNGDGAVDYKDVDLLGEDWLRCTECIGGRCRGIIVERQFLAADVNKDYYVDFLDFAVLANRWLAGY